MKITVISKYAPVPGYGSNPRWFELGKWMVCQNHSVQIITSDSNHGSNFDLENRPSATIVLENVCFTVIKTFKYRRSVSVARVISWFDFDLKLFRFFRHVSPDVVLVSSLSLSSIIFGLYIRARHGSRLVLRFAISGR